MQSVKNLFPATLAAAVVVLCLAAPQAALANCGHCDLEMKQDMAAKKVEMMTEKLGLSEDQAQQLKTIIQTKHEAMDAAKAQFQADLDAILTPEQKAKHEEMKAMREEKHEHGKHDKDCGCEMCAMKKKHKHGDDSEE